MSGVRRERLVAFGALGLAKAPEVQLVVVAQEMRQLAKLRQFRQLPQTADQRLGLAAREREEGVLVCQERKQHVQPRTVAEIFRHLVRQHIRLGEQDGVALAPAEEIAELAKEFVVAADRLIGLDLLDHEWGRVDPEAGHAEFQPETDDLEDLLAHSRVHDVEVGLMRIEAVEIPGVRPRIVGPDARLVAGKDDAVIAVERLGLGPDVILAEGRCWVGACVAEPGVPLRCMIDRQVNDESQATQPRLVAEFDEVAECPQLRRDVVIVGDVVAVVQPRAGVERQQPDAIDAKLGDMVEAVSQPLEIADAVIVAVHVGGDIEGIDNGVLVPKVEH
jgi:hypothetical protein